MGQLVMGDLLSTNSIGIVDKVTTLQATGVWLATCQWSQRPFTLNTPILKALLFSLIRRHCNPGMVPNIVNFAAFGPSILFSGNVYDIHTRRNLLLFNIPTDV